ncbi:hypothetical protein LXA43DRAFT_482180 [Ganoderma leucocontextum]|nr:hypothetical protein LXA43DRAFT_482180 [Ganoderma leucocontextum]
MPRPLPQHRLEQGHGRTVHEDHLQGHRPRPEVDAQQCGVVSEPHGRVGRFHGLVEGDGTLSIEAAHASRNTSVKGLVWIGLPGLGKTESGVTPWPRGGDDLNFTAGTGPSIEYDFFLFNTQGQNGTVTITTKISPSLNSTLGDSRPMGLALRADNGTPQTNIIEVPFVFPVRPGTHTLKVRITELSRSKGHPSTHPTSVFAGLDDRTDGRCADDSDRYRRSDSDYLGPPESVRV